MIAQCPTCKARYRVDDAKVGPGGTKFKCKKCRNTFTVFREVQQQEQQDPVRRAPTTRNCPHCGKPIPFQAVKCRYCREAVDKAVGGFDEQEAHADEGGGEHQDPFVPQGGPGAEHQDPFVPQGGPGAEHQDPFVPQAGGAYSGADAFDDDDSFGGGAPGYGGPPEPGGGGYGGGPAYQQPTIPSGGVPSYLAQAILVTLFCCLPFGIVAIVYAAQVNGKLAGGDISGAMESSSKAKLWSWISFGVGLGIAVIYFLLGFLGAAFHP